MVPGSRDEGKGEEGDQGPTNLHPLENLFLSDVVVSSVHYDLDLRPFLLGSSDSRPEDSLATAASITERVEETDDAVPIVLAAAITGSPAPRLGVRPIFVFERISELADERAPPLGLLAQV